MLLSQRSERAKSSPDLKIFILRNPKKPTPSASTPTDPRCCSRVERRQNPILSNGANHAGPTRDRDISGERKERWKMQREIKIRGERDASGAGPRDHRTPELHGKTRRLKADR
ncbi:unnamed protein product [Brassica rapa subsp. trilocularis]